MKVGEFKKYKDSLYGALSRDLTEFEKNFLLVSGGVFAFSITFIKDIIKVETTQYLSLLFLGWAFIIISLALMMITFLKSASACDKLWLRVDCFMNDNQLFKDDTDVETEKIVEIKRDLSEILLKSKKSLKKTRNTAVASFIIGLIFFAFFIAVNLVNEKNRTVKASDNKNIKKDSLFNSSIQ